jgi:hypothetical protein
MAAMIKHETVPAPSDEELKCNSNSHLMIVGQEDEIPCTRSAAV